MVPVISPFSFGEKAISSGQSTSVQCVMTEGDTPVNFLWAHNGEYIHSNDAVSIGKFGKKISVLAIDSVRAEDFGNYTCQVQNSAGIATHTAQLLVNGLCIHITKGFLIFLWFCKFVYPFYSLFFRAGGNLF